MPLREPFKLGKLGGGRKTAQYRDANGRTRDCIITGDGATAGNVNIRILVPQGTGTNDVRHTGSNHIKNDVPIATGMKDTDAVFWRQGAV